MKLKKETATEPEYKTAKVHMVFDFDVELIDYTGDYPFEGTTDQSVVDWMANMGAGLTGDDDHYRKVLSFLWEYCGDSDLYSGNPEIDITLGD